MFAGPVKVDGQMFDCENVAGGDIEENEVACDPVAVQEMVQGCRRKVKRLGFQREEVDIIDGYVGRGYAQSRPEELTFIRDVARSEGLILDPVYTGKAFYGLAQELRRRRDAFGQRVVFIHTGGIFGLFPKAAELEPLL